MDKVEVKFINEHNKTKTIDCYIARSINQKIRGLRDLEYLDENKGMIFPFKFSNYRFFNIKDMLISLDIIFINKNMFIKKIFETDGNPNKLYYGYCKYVIETNRGFCYNHNIKVEDKIQII